MIHQKLYIGRWDVDCFFVLDRYYPEEVLDALYLADAPKLVMRRAEDIMYDEEENAGFTYANPETYKAVVVIGPASSGREFIDTVVHEIHHLAVAIASNLGVDLESEHPAYISGDAARAVAGIICQLGCKECNG